MNVDVLRLAIHPPADRMDGLRLEELGYRTALAALDDAGVARGQLDTRGRRWRLWRPARPARRWCATRTSTS